jgi:hypothetical protein
VVDNIIPCSLVKVTHCFRGKDPFQERQARRDLLAAFFMLVSCMAYSLTLKMEAIHSSEMLLEFHWITWRYISEDRILQIKFCS